MNKKKTIVPAIRSSAAEYLTFVAASGQDGVEAVYADEDVWLSQKMMSVLYDVETNTINYHLKKIFSDNELEEDSVIRNFRITAKDGKSYNTQHYNLSGIIAVGYKVNSERAVQFRKWATPRLNKLMSNPGFLEPRMNTDKHRLKSIRACLCLSVVKKVLELKS